MNTLRVLLPNSDNLHIWITSILMVVGLFFFNWKPEVVILAYLFETIIIGLIHIFKMIAVALFSEKERNLAERKPAWFVIPFFCFHFFFFIAIQMIFVFLFIGFDKTNIHNGMILGLLQNFKSLFSMPDMQEAYLIIILNNVFHTAKTFFANGKYLESTLDEIFMQPYLRVFVQQFVAIFGGFLFMLTGGALSIALLLIGLKTSVDLLGVSLPKNAILREKVVDFLFKTKDKNLTQTELDNMNNFKKMLE